MAIITLKSIGSGLLCAALTVSMSSCEGESGGSAGGNGAATPAVKDAGNALGDLATKAKDAAGDATSAFKEEYETQLNNHESKLDALKATAKSFTDKGLNDLLGQLDGQIAIGRAELANVVSGDPGAMDAMKSKLQTIMAEITKLYNQAMTRISELKG